ncbi:MAG: non-ribosomal peptide synthetase, partial [Acidobacteria bacterium]|nr:non-ribosomal peptide synthetase [Acidobacteriota bacterium]
YDFNNTATDYPKDKTIHQLFEEQVEKSSDHIAAIGSSLLSLRKTQLTYKKLNEKCNQLASILREQGVEPDSIIAIIVERSIEMIIGILGILKSGGSYLPIDPDYPQERIDYILKDSGTKLLVTTNDAEVEKVRKWEGEKVFLEFINHYSNHLSFHHSSFISHHSSNLAYIIYTSGSTGIPKGVLVEHYSVVNMVMSRKIRFNTGPRGRVIITSSICFDASVEQLFATLLFGSVSVIVDIETLMDKKLFQFFVACHCSTHLFAMPSILRLLPLDGKYRYALNQITTGGEPCPVSLVDNWRRCCNFFNEYGLTETAVTALETGIDTIDKIIYHMPLGKPIPNVMVFILNSWMNLVPLLVTGELYIGGEGIARGYLNNPELTSEKFIGFLDFPKLLPDFHSPLTTHKSPLTLYRTGDLARWLPDGNIEFLGRIDHQVKIRGFRIELGEIESQLLKHALIKEAVVTAREEKNGEKYLCAYFVSNSPDSPDISISTQLREYLSERLPAYMIPSYFVSLERLPLTPSGKIDRKSLPAPELTAGEGFIPPRNELEKKLARIWLELLLPPNSSQKAIGINDNFFHLGGHSLKATIMISKINNEMHVDMPLVEIFKSPTIRQLAEYIEKMTGQHAGILVDNLISLKKGTSNTHHLFFVHDGTGQVEGYLEFCNHLDNQFNCWGIRPDAIKNYTPQNITIEEMAGKYIEKIKKIQPQGPYFIAGWSLGGTIAFEIVKQLEETGKTTAFLGLFDSPGPGMSQEQSNNQFTLQSEINNIKEYLPDLPIKVILEKVANLEELWPAIVDYMKENSIAAETIKKLIAEHGIPGFNYDKSGIEELILHLNMTRTLLNARERYIPSGKIKVQVHYFEALESIGKIKQRWNEYCESAIEYYNIPGDHFSIFKMPYIEKFARLFQEVLKLYQRNPHASTLPVK